VHTACPPAARRQRPPLASPPARRSSSRAPVTSRAAHRPASLLSDARRPTPAASRVCRLHEAPPSRCILGLGPRPRRSRTRPARPRRPRDFGRCPGARRRRSSRPECLQQGNVGYSCVMDMSWEVWALLSDTMRITAEPRPLTIHPGGHGGKEPQANTMTQHFWLCSSHTS